MSGGNYTAKHVEGSDWWENGYQDDYKIQGFGGSLTNRIELNSKSEKAGIFYENKLSMYHQKHGFLDGTQEYNLKLMSNSFGLKVKLYDPANRKKNKGK